MIVKCASPVISLTYTDHQWLNLPVTNGKRNLSRDCEGDKLLFSVGFHRDGEREGENLYSKIMT